MANLFYVAAATNRFTQAADIYTPSDISSNATSPSLIALGSSKLVALWDLDNEQHQGISETLPGSTGLITCVKFLAHDTLVTANDAGMLTIWRRHANSQWTSTATIQAHPKAISTLAVQGGSRIVTGASDSTAKVWKYRQGGETDELVEVQTISLNGKYPLSSALSYLPGTNASILAISGTDTRVHLYVCSEETFVHSATLAGHEDWIRSLAFKEPEAAGQPLVLASGSQDATIRLWNIELWVKAQEKAIKTTTTSAEQPIDELLDNFEASLGELGENEEGGRQISLKHHVLTVNTSAETSQQFSVTFDALLVGHEAGITSLAWRPPITGSTRPAALLSTSTDSSVILWSQASIATTSAASPDTTDTSTTTESASLWINQQRFGDVGGQRLGGFVGGLWARGGAEALAWGWAGGWRRWASTSGAGTQDVAQEVWVEKSAVCGHNGPVKGLDWSPDGRYIASVGLDQTTRIHAPITVPGSSQPFTSWAEIARPQVHGYDLLNVVFVSPLQLASIADEKVLRVFDAPRTFVALAERLGVAQFSEQEREENKARPAAANVPPLGLSNKAVNDADATQEAISDADLSRRPFESELASITLWPETEKVFGHGYESITLGISHSRKLVATACKSTSAEHAVVRVYSTEAWRPVSAPLAGHVLTVTRVAFSPDDRYVLTVSRDRSWRLFELAEGETGGYVPVAADKSHGRIIWDCGWSQEGDVFATASRDKTVKIWGKVENIWKALETIKTPQPATAVAFAIERGGKRNLAIGLESGEILVYIGSVSDSKEWRLSETVPSKLAHVDHIHRMSWRPCTQGGVDELATCSEDGTLRILSIRSSLDLE